MDLSVFLTTENLIFFSIIFALLAIFLVVCFVVIRAIFRFIKSLFKKNSEEYTMEDAMADKGENLEVYVKKVKKNPGENAEIQNSKQHTPIMEYNQPNTKQEPKKDVQESEEQK